MAKFAPLSRQVCEVLSSFPAFFRLIDEITVSAIKDLPIMDFVTKDSGNTPSTCRAPKPLCLHQRNDNNKSIAVRLLSSVSYDLGVLPMGSIMELSPLNVQKDQLAAWFRSPDITGLRHAIFVAIAQIVAFPLLARKHKKQWDVVSGILARYLWKQQQKSTVEVALVIPVQQLHVTVILVKQDQETFDDRVGIISSDFDLTDVPPLRIPTGFSNPGEDFEQAGLRIVREQANCDNAKIEGVLRAYTRHVHSVSFLTEIVLVARFVTYLTKEASPPLSFVKPGWIKHTIPCYWGSDLEKQRALDLCEDAVTGCEPVYDAFETFKPHP